MILRVHIDVPLAGGELLRLLGVSVASPLTGAWTGLPLGLSQITGGSPTWATPAKLSGIGSSTPCPCATGRAVLEGRTIHWLKLTGQYCLCPTNHCAIPSR